MTLHKTYVGRNPDGTPHFHYIHDDPTGSTTVMKTGPIYGEITLPDGTTYDVTDEYVEVPLEHAGALNHHIGLRHEDDGHPDHGDPSHPEYVPFAHVCTELCGEHARTADETVARFEERADTTHQDHQARVANLRANHVNPGA